MLYRAAKLAPPRVVWSGSPLAQGLARARAEPGLAPGDNVRDVLWAVYARDVGLYSAGLGKDVVAVGESIKTSLAVDSAGYADGEVRRSLAESVAQSLYGQHHASSIASFSHYRDLRGRRETAGHVGVGWELLAASAGWILPHRKLCWVSERHNVLCRDEGGRLHCDSGPAVAFPDGWTLYFWHGVRVPAEWIERREQVDPSLVLTHPNVEQRRALGEIIGWSKVLHHVPSRVIDQHPDPTIGTLLECDLPGFGPSRFIKVRCGTGRDFVLCVPRQMSTALQANAWTYDMAASDYGLEART